ncbi:MAG: DUF2271 domain-containing protein [Bacteroidota bacterium]
MKDLLKSTVWLGILSLVMVGFTLNTAPTTANYKCMIQLANYEGHGAYVVVSILDKGENYVETIYVQGQDDEWYHDIPEWWKFFEKKKPEELDGITGATVGGGQRTIRVLKIPADKINSGHHIRFETAVEDQNYFKDDVQFELTNENLKKKMEGKGYIRYIRMLPTS